MPPRPAVLALAATAALTVAAGSASALPSVTTVLPSASYIVTTSGPAAPVADLVRALGGEIGFVYSNALNGFSVRLPVAALPSLDLLPGVLAVEPDAVMSVSATQTPTPSYGLDRVDQRALPLSGSYTSAGNGAGVRAYIIDTGIQYGHVDFGGRAVGGFDATQAGGPASDCNGHGTHVAGTTGGAQYGVAKGVTLVAVKVLGCNGSGATSGVIAGVDWVAADHRAGTPAVANMSLGGGASAALDTAVNNAIADGVSFVAAAGNEGGGLLAGVLGTSNACNSSPARVPGALTVGATDATDTKASYSNIGTCLDLFAPGSAITSAWFTSPTATSTISGTSMAAPHVAGAAALLLQANPAATPAQISQQILAAATPNVVKSPGTGSPNRLLFVR